MKLDEFFKCKSRFIADFNGPKEDLLAHVENALVDAYYMGALHERGHKGEDDGDGKEITTKD